MQPVADRLGFIAKLNASVHRRDPLHHAGASCLRTHPPHRESAPRQPAHLQHTMASCNYATSIPTKISVLSPWLVLLRRASARPARGTLGYAVWDEPRRHMQTNGVTQELRPRHHQNKTGHRFVTSIDRRGERNGLFDFVERFIDLKCRRGPELRPLQS
jgi:hypothetical protein